MALPRAAILECNFLYEAKNYLRDLLQVFNLYGTKYEEASEWVRATRKSPQSVVDYAAKTFGETNVNTVFLRQLPKCIEPFIDMRNAVEHPRGHSGELILGNLSFAENGTFVAPFWSREKNGKTEYGPVGTVADMKVGIHNLLILGEDILIMWALTHLSMPGVMEVTVVPELRRSPICPIKYRITGSALLKELMKAGANRSQTC
jgi:hypothetical protein